VNKGWVVLRCNFNIPYSGIKHMLCIKEARKYTLITRNMMCMPNVFFQEYLFNSIIIIILKLCELCVKKPWYALSYKFMCIYMSHSPHIFGYQTSTKFCRIFNPSTLCWSWIEDCCFCVQCTASEFILEVYPMRSSRSVTHKVLQCFSSNLEKAQ